MHNNHFCQVSWILTQRFLKYIANYKKSLIMQISYLLAKTFQQPYGTSLSMHNNKVCQVSLILMQQLQKYGLIHENN